MSNAWRKNAVRIKICGLASNAEEVLQEGIDYAGLIFYSKSPRYVVGKLDANSVQAWSKNILKVGVFVNEDLEQIVAHAKDYGLNYIQLHGDESPDDAYFLKSCGIGVIKAFGVGEDFNFQIMEPFLDKVDFFLFDTKTPEHGGSGKSFNWKSLENYPYEVPFFVGGGVGVENLPDLLSLQLPKLFAVDLNSKLEISPGLKDMDKVRKAVSIVREF